MQTPQIETIREILKNLSDKMTNIIGFNCKWRETQIYRNPTALYEALKDYTAYYKHTEPILKQWIQAYLAENKRYLFARLWLDHSREYLIGKYKNTTGLFLHPRFGQEWPHAVQQSPATSYEWAENFVNFQLSIKRIENCTDRSILAIHENQPCKSNGWFCDLCEDMEFKWLSKLEHEIKNSTNIILNNNYHESFATDFTKQETYLPEDWLPPKVYGFSWATSVPILTLNEIDKEIRKKRLAYTEDFKAKFQCWEDLYDCFTSPTTGLQFHYTEKLQPYEIFGLLWPKLDIWSTLLKMDMKRAEDIMKM